MVRSLGLAELGVMRSLGLAELALLPNPKLAVLEVVRSLGLGWRGGAIPRSRGLAGWR